MMVVVVMIYLDMVGWSLTGRIITEAILTVAMDAGESKGKYQQPQDTASLSQSP